MTTPLKLDANYDLSVFQPGDRLGADVLPTSAVLNDGSTAFVAPQPGVDPAQPADLTTMRWVAHELRHAAWLPPVFSIENDPPLTPMNGDRYIIGAAPTGAWAGHADELVTRIEDAWEYDVPLDGHVTIRLDTFKATVYHLGDWGAFDALTNHLGLSGVQGGSATEQFHLSAAQHGVVTADHAARTVLAAPTTVPGPATPRALEMADIQSGILPSAQGGLGTNASASDGYAKFAAGAPTFADKIPWIDLSGVPSVLPPTTHAATHEAGGGDAIAVSPSQLNGPVPTTLGGTGVDAATVGNRRVFATDESGAPGFRTLDAQDTPGITAYDVSGLVGQRRGLQFVGSAVKGLLDDGPGDRVLITLEDTSVVQAIAGASLSALRFVRPAANGKVEYATNTNIAHRNVLGITLTAALADDDIQIATAGRITDLGWSWNPLLPIWLETNGMLTQTPSVTGISLVVAQPQSPTTIIVAIGVPILLA